ncbi:MAG: pyridine nucleotide-disulfide oxidoreductase [Actinobacteria bacterium RBG_16_68_21]|nr:MAG: pyridine nucleotide-disulfide oxidoreductase [Actinobacteria bacterium RBG_16_68_21]
MSDAKTVVILGGGVGGVVTAATLREQLPHQHRIVLVDREPDHLFAPSLLWLITGQRTARQISRPLDRLAKKGIEVVCGDVDRIDPGTRQVSIIERSSTGATSREIEADYLVVSLGGELAPDTIPGLAEAGHSFYTLAGAESLRDALRTFEGGRIVVLTAAPAYKCPAAPYEAAMLINDQIRKRKLDDRTHIDLYAAEPGPLGVAGPDVSAGVRSMVEAAGIDYHPEHQVVSVDTPKRRLVFANGATAEFDLLAYVPPHQAPRVVRDAGMVDDSGWIPADRNTLHTGYDGVYAIGDVTGIPLKMGKLLPMAGVFAERQAKVVAHNISHDITGDGEMKWFDGNGECFVETGGGKAGFGRGDFYAEPAPQVTLHPVGRRWHLGKVLFEKRWLSKWF